jgi:hypothetical protein
MTDNRLDLVSGKRPKRTHIFAKATDLHYVEPAWCSLRLFAVGNFPDRDYFCGTGQGADAARAAGYQVRGTDITDYGYELFDGIEDFLAVDRIDPDVSLVSNPPFEDRILQHAINLNPIKAALIWQLARLVAAHAWLSTTPLARVLMLMPQPRMPPGSYLAAGKKPQGARVEHAWLIFERGYRGQPRLGWLHRDFDIAVQRDGAAA